MRNAMQPYDFTRIDPSGFDLDAARRLDELLVFDVVKPAAGMMAGLPFLKPHGASRYAWCLPALGGEFDFYLGWEMAQAYLRARYCPSCTELDPSPMELSEITKAMELGRASDDHRDGFLVCIGMFMDRAMHALDQMPAILRRLAWLDDDRLRERCKALLAGQVVADIFDPRFDALMGAAMDEHGTTPPTPEAIQAAYDEGRFDASVLYQSMLDAVMPHEEASIGFFEIHYCPVK